MLIQTNTQLSTQTKKRPKVQKLVLWIKVELNVTYEKLIDKSVNKYTRNTHKLFFWIKSTGDDDVDNKRKYADAVSFLIFGTYSNFVFKRKKRKKRDNPRALFSKSVVDDWRARKVECKLFPLNRKLKNWQGSLSIRNAMKMVLWW